jgi:hypothetical protein
MRRLAGKAERLKLDGNKIGRVDMLFANSLKLPACPLLSLSLEACSLASESLSTVLASVKANSSLRLVNLSRNELSDKLSQQLREALL